jgi:hypothetical protein
MSHGLDVHVGTSKQDHDKSVGHCLESYKLIAILSKWTGDCY